ncbi:MAG: cytochrome c, partial [Akkermansiaceae bacterium]|nr:cytochrome c [Armatimonadota bacterium]
VAALLGVVTLSGCHVDMWIQPKAKPYYQSDFFSDGQASRPLVEGAVPQGTLRLRDAYHTGYDAPGATGAATGTSAQGAAAGAEQNASPTGTSQGATPTGGMRTGQGPRLTKTIPAEAVRSFASPKEMLLRGQEQYNVYCQPCHGKTGNGNGMIMQRGVGYWQKLAASYHTKRIREIEDGHIYDVITNGYGVMYGYSSRIQDVNDRWAIVAYTRALQRAQAGVPATPELESKIRASTVEAPTEESADTRKGETMRDKGSDYKGNVKAEADPKPAEGPNQ